MRILTKAEILSKSSYGIEIAEKGVINVYIYILHLGLRSIFTFYVYILCLRSTFYVYVVHLRLVLFLHSTCTFTFYIYELRALGQH